MIFSARLGGACLLLLAFVADARAGAQTVQTSVDAAPGLAAVSIRPSASPGPIRIRANPGRVDINGASLLDLIRNAYGEPTPIPPYRISGATSWMQDERFDIQATIPEGAPPLTPRSTLLALRALLVERFNLRVRVDTLESAVYVLSRLPTAPNTADRLKPTTASCDVTARFGGPAAPSVLCDAIRIKGGQRFQMDGRGVTIAQLAGELSSIPAISRAVIDRTGLDGRYDFTLEWVPPTAVTTDNAAQADAPRDTGPSVFAALEEQLGLRLASSRGPVEILVIQSADRPRPN